MKQMRVALLAGMLALAGFSAGAEELKVGFVNTQRVIRDAPAAIKAAKRLDQEFGKRDQELKRLADDIQSREDYLRNKGATLSEAERRQKERDLGELSRDFQRKRDQFREDLNARQNEENTALIEKANVAIRQIAMAEKFDVILQEAVVVSDRIDITDKVIKALSDEGR